MRIKQLQLDHFSSHVHTSIVFEKPISLIVGNLNAGKTSILSAIEYALTGECGFYRKRTDDRAELIHDLVADDTNKHFIVDMTSDRFQIKRMKSPMAEVIEFNGQPQNAATTEALVSTALKFGKSTVSALLNTSNFFDLDQASQKELIIGLVGAQVTHEKVLELFKGDPKAFDRIGRRLDSIDTIQKGYDYAYGARRDVNRELKELKPPDPPQGTPPPVDKLQALMSELETELQEKIRIQGQHAGLANVDATRQRLEARRDTLTKEIETMRSELPKSAEKKLKEAIDEAKKTRGDVADLFLALEGKLIEVKAQLVSRQKNVALLSDFKGICVAGDHACPAPVADMAKAKDQQLALLKKLQSAETELVGEMEKLNVTRNDLGPQQKAEASLHQFQQRVALGKQKTAELESVTAELSKLPKAIDPAIVAKLDEEVATLRQRIAKGKQQLQEAASWMERDRQVKAVAERRRTLEVAQRQLESLVDFLGPKGVKVQLIDERISGFVDTINQYLQPFGFTLGIQVEPWKIMARGRPLNRLSRSERFRLGLAFQCAIAKMTGLNAVYVDDAEILTPEVRTAMFKMLMDAKLDQAIVVMTLMNETDFVKSRPNFPPSIEVLMVRNEGGLSRVEKI